MGTDRIDRLKFGSVVALPDDALVRGARGLMLLPGGGHVAVQRYLGVTWQRLWISGIFVMRPFLYAETKSGDKASLRDRLSIQPPTDEEHLGTRERLDR